MSIYTCMCKHTHTNIYIYIYIHKYTNMYTWLNNQGSIKTRRFSGTYIHINIYKHTNIYIYIYVNVYIFVYISIFAISIYFIYIPDSITRVLLNLNAIAVAVTNPASRSPKPPFLNPCSWNTKWTRYKYFCIHIYIYIYIYMHIYICIYICTYIHRRSTKPKFLNPCSWNTKRTRYKYICIYIYIHMYIYIYVHIYIDDLQKPHFWIHAHGTQSELDLNIFAYIYIYIYRCIYICTYIHRRSPKPPFLNPCSWNTKWTLIRKKYSWLGIYKMN
jgi:hypothetical protein